MPVQIMTLEERIVLDGAAAAVIADIIIDQPQGADDAGEAPAEQVAPAPEASAPEGSGDQAAEPVQEPQDADSAVDQQGEPSGQQESGDSVDSGAVEATATGVTDDNSTPETLLAEQPDSTELSAPTAQTAEPEAMTGGSEADAGEQSAESADNVPEPQAEAQALESEASDQAEADSVEQAAEASGEEQGDEVEAAAETDKSEHADPDGASAEALATAPDEETALDGQADASDYQVRAMVISSNLEDGEDLAAAVRDDVVTVTYNANRDTPDDILRMVSEALDGREADSIAFATHDMGEGRFHLTGEYSVTAGSLLDNPEISAFWEGIGDLMSEDGRIDLMACDLAATAEGELLLSVLEGITGADVAASDDATGNVEDGGDWLLEAGYVDLAAVYFKEEKLGEYDGVMAGSPPIVEKLRDSITSGVRHWVPVGGYLFSAYGGNPTITELRVVDTAVGGGHIFYNGINYSEQSDYFENGNIYDGEGNYLSLGSSAEFMNVWYYTGDNSGTNTLRVGAYNGIQWNEQPSPTVDIISTNEPPVVEKLTDSRNVNDGDRFTLNNIFTISDPDSPNDMEELRIVDQDVGGGYILFEGNIYDGENNWLQLNDWTDFYNVSFVAGSAGSVDVIRVGVFDGEQWNVQPSPIVTVRTAGGSNSAPVLDATGNMNLTNVAENTASPAGDLVSAIIGSAGGDRITDADGDPEGVAVVQLDTANGTWQYDAGSGWTNFGAVTTNSATLLSANAKVRFIPSANYTGSATMWFRAWDASDGNNSGDTGVNTVPNGGTNAFSGGAAETATVAVAAAGGNNRPVLDNSSEIALTTIQKNDVNSSGQLVSSIISGRFSDSDSDPAGIAIVGVDNGTGGAKGTWQYSTNGGVSWQNITHYAYDDATLLAADANARVRFVPNVSTTVDPDPGDGVVMDSSIAAGFTGRTSITFLAWDRTEGASGGTLDTSGKDSVSAQAAQANLTVNSPPTTSAKAGQVSLSQGGKVSMSALFNYADADNDVFTEFAIKVQTNGGGYLEYNGQKDADGNVTVNSLAELSKVYYVAGPQGSADTVKFGLMDGLQWQEGATPETVIAATAPVAQPTTPPSGQNNTTTSDTSDSSGQTVTTVAPPPSAPTQPSQNQQPNQAPQQATDDTPVKRDEVVYVPADPIKSIDYTTPHQATSNNSADLDASTIIDNLGKYIFEKTILNSEYSFDSQTLDYNSSMTYQHPQSTALSGLPERNGMVFGRGIDGHGVYTNEYSERNVDGGYEVDMTFHNRSKADAAVEVYDIDGNLVDTFFIKGNRTSDFVDGAIDLAWDNTISTLFGGHAFTEDTDASFFIPEGGYAEISYSSKSALASNFLSLVTEGIPIPGISESNALSILQDLSIEQMASAIEAFVKADAAGNNITVLINQFWENSAKAGAGVALDAIIVKAGGAVGAVYEFGEKAIFATNKITHLVEMNSMKNADSKTSWTINPNKDGYDKFSNKN